MWDDIGENYFGAKKHRTNLVDDTQVFSSRNINFHKRLCDVFLDESLNAVQPDVLFTSNANKDTLKQNSGVHGAPDLIIEILSPGNSSHDRITKKHLYEHFGVKEYWIIDAETKESTGYALNNRKFELIGHFKEIIKSVLFDQEFRFWEAPL